MQRLRGSVAFSQPYSWLPPYIYEKEDPQSNNRESEERPQEALPQEEALYLPQLKTSKLKHIFSIKYLSSLKVINIYHVL